jgi:hypothetical protein
VREGQRGRPAHRSCKAYELLVGSKDTEFNYRYLSQTTEFLVLNSH